MRALSTLTTLNYKLLGLVSVIVFIALILTSGRAKEDAKCIHLFLSLFKYLLSNFYLAHTTEQKRQKSLSSWRLYYRRIR